MPTSTAADRARDRRAAALGPYETAYDVRRGYDQPPARRPRPDEDEPAVLLFRPRDPDAARR